MRVMGTMAIGAVLGFVLMAALAAVSFKQITEKSEQPSGLEVLAAGATEWAPLASPGGPVSRMWRAKDGRLLVSTQTTPFGSWWSGSKWEQTQELPPSLPSHPTIADVHWFHLANEVWLTVTTGSCTPTLEPQKTALPVIPRCVPEKVGYRLTAATQLSDQTILIIYWHDDDQTFRGYTLTNGAWVDTGTLPLVAASARLIAGKDRSAIVVGGDGKMARFDGSKWTLLPMMKSERIGWEGGLADDGTVFAAGGFKDKKKANSTLISAIVIGFLLASVFIARTYKLSLLAMTFGGSVGIVLAIGAFFAIWILIGARF